MKKIISLLLICAMLALTACGSTGEENTDNTTTEKEDDKAKETVNYDDYKTKVNFMCYNVFYKDVADRAENIFDLILQKDPDVLVLQEVSYDWIPYMQTFMSDNGYSYYGYGRHGAEMSDPNMGTGDQFTPVLWKTDKYELKDSGHFWLSSTPDVPQSAAWEDGVVSKYPRCVNWVKLQDKETEQEFITMCIHTDPESDLVRENSSTFAVQKLDEIRGDLPAIVGGDWNMSITDQAYKIVAEGGYPDVRFRAEETTYEGSFNAWGEREEGNFAMGDHIFTSDNMFPKTFEVVEDYYDGVHISDHNPLFTEVYF